MSLAEPTERSSEGTGPERPVPGPAPHEQLGRAFKATMAAVRRLRGRETHSNSEVVSNAQYGLLFSLLDHSELSSRDLAEMADLAPATVTQMLEALEGAELVRRVRASHDRRIVLTSLTDHGRQLCAERRARIDPLWRAALEEFSDEELLSAVRVLDRLAEFFDQMRL